MSLLNAVSGPANTVLIF